MLLHRFLLLSVVIVTLPYNVRTISSCVVSEVIVQIEFATPVLAFTLHVAL